MRNHVRKLLCFLILLVFLLNTTTACTKAATPKLSKTSGKMEIQKSVTITLNGVSKKAVILKDADLLKKKSTTKYIYWSTKDPVTASIKASKNKVTITGRKAGKTTVRARYKGKNYNIAVTVTAPKENLSVEDVSVTLAKDIPKYWAGELSDSINKANARTGSGVATTLYFTDTHWEANAQHSPQIINFLNKMLHTPIAIFGGDVITGTHATAKEAKAEVNSFYKSFSDVNLFSTVGNHDRNNHDTKLSSKVHLSTNEIYDMMIKPEEAFAKTTGNLNNAYTDDKANKVRYVMFYYDVKHPEYYTNSVQSWVDKRVKELDASWTVILVSHAYWDYAKPDQTCAIPAKSKEIASHLLTLEKESDATIAAWLVGHTHRDLNKTITDKSGTTRLNITSFNCDAYQKSLYTGANTMKKGTDTEQSMNIMQIDTNKKRIYLTRVGAGKDNVIYY